MRPASIALILSVASAAALHVACKDTAKNEPSPQSGEPATKAAGSAPVATAPSAVPAVSAAPAASTTLTADATGALTLAWKVASAPNDHVTVSAVVGDRTFALGELNASSDDGPGGVKTCAMRDTSTTGSSVWCGNTPELSAFTAKLSGGALVFERLSGAELGPDEVKKTVTEVTRSTTAATTVKSTGPASPALYGNCRPGHVQRSEQGICMRQCLKGNECTGSDKCEMIKVKGTDGDHKVHACVPPGK